MRTTLARRLALALVPIVLSTSLAAQEPPERERLDVRPVLEDTIPTKLYELPPLNITATRTVRDVFETAAPVSVIDQLQIRRRAPNTAADLLRDLPGLDVNGVGANQTRPVIRGQRGQRILLLEDGLRMNNSRRQQDFGELPAIVDVNDLQRVEVVRGPASVLYGSDAVGGVINLITEGVPVVEDGSVGGRLQYTFRDAGDQHRPNAEAYGRFGGFGVRVSGTFRDTEPYRAPEGTFGNVTLNEDVLVADSGVRDGNVSALVEYRFPEIHRVFAKVENYWADDAGFGFVANDALGLVNAPDIQIAYPDQDVNKVTLGYRALGLGLPVADRLDVTGYRMDNERRFALDIFIPFEDAPPGAGVVSTNENFTDVETLGFRLEAAKLLGDDVILTYGTDFFRDATFNTDETVTGVVGFGPPQFETTNAPNVPNASYRSLGVFAQADVTIADRVSIVAGARFQDVRADTDPTENLDLPPTSTSDQTVVGAANVLVEVVPYLNLVAAVGRAFRAPNLVELFFNGPTPEGAGFQVRNPDLEAEKSVNVDLGIKYRRDRVGFEAYYFRNEVRDGIRIAPTGEMVGPFPGFQNVNIDELLFEGVEVLGQVMPIEGLTVGGSYTYLDSKDVLNPNNPLGDTFSSKITGRLSYRDGDGRFWAEYRVRRNGEQKDFDAGFLNVVGETLPAFTVHDVRAGVRVLRLGRTEHHLRLGVENLTNELYAEFSNATFFRPEARRHLTLGWTTSF